MKKILNFTIFVVLSFLFAGLIGCGIKVDCPEFDEGILSWLPYQKNDVIELYSQSKDSTITFSINIVEITHKTHYTIGTKCGTCDDYIIMNSAYNTSNFKVDIRLNKNKIERQDYQIIDTFFEEHNTIYSELRNYKFENDEYDIVRVFEKTDSRGTFKKLIIAKDIGIIGLVDIHGNTWTLLKPEVKIRRLNEREGVVINNVGC